jgi:hypothetical protein
MVRTVRVGILLLALSACSSEPSSSSWQWGVPGPDAGDDAGDAADDGSPDVVVSDSPGQDATDVSVDEPVTNEPWVRIDFPSHGEQVPDPVTFQFSGGNGVVSVWFEVDDWPLQQAPLPLQQQAFTYDFNTVNQARHVVLEGRDATGATVAVDELDFTPVQLPCSVPDQPGFNHYVVALINDATRYPKDGTYPYCWESQGSTCGANWGMVHGGSYVGDALFPGGEDCFCSGHTLELFLSAYRAWQLEAGVDETEPFRVDTHELPLSELDPYDKGTFYQYWQGFGVTSDASSADAFETFGIGVNLYEDSWDAALPGDFVNLSRSTGSGHAVIFISWVLDNGIKVGLRYYGCNGSGHSCPDAADSANTTGNSGPSFVTEYFEGHGGTVLPSYLHIGRAYVPTGP